MQLILYTRDGCHLCERLEQLLAPHLERLRQRGEVALIKRDIDDGHDWYEQYHARIPVLTCDDRVILEGRPEPLAVAMAMGTLI